MQILAAFTGPSVQDQTQSQGCKIDSSMDRIVAESKRRRSADLQYQQYVPDSTEAIWTYRIPELANARQLNERN